METFREKYLQHFGGQFGGEIYEKFIKATTVHRDDSGTLLINAPNEATLRWLKANLDKPLRELAHEYFSDGIKIQYTTRPSATTPPPPPPPPNRNGVETKRRRRRHRFAQPVYATI